MKCCTSCIEWGIRGYDLPCYHMNYIKYMIHKAVINTIFYYIIYITNQMSRVHLQQESCILYMYQESYNSLWYPREGQSMLYMIYDTTYIQNTTKWYKHTVTYCITIRLGLHRYGQASGTKKNENQWTVHAGMFTSCRSCWGRSVLKATKGNWQKLHAAKRA